MCINYYDQIVPWKYFRGTNVTGSDRSIATTIVAKTHLFRSRVRYLPERFTISVFVKS